MGTADGNSLDGTAWRPFTASMLGKILFLAAIFAIVYFGYRYFAQRERLKRAEKAGRVDQGHQGGQPSQTMSKCAVCGAYVAPGAGSCGKPGCPY